MTVARKGCKSKGGWTRRGTIPPILLLSNLLPCPLLQSHWRWWPSALPRRPAAHAVPFCHQGRTCQICGIAQICSALKPSPSWHKGSYHDMARSCHSRIPTPGRVGSSSITLSESVTQYMLQNLNYHASEWEATNGTSKYTLNFLEQVTNASSINDHWQRRLQTRSNIVTQTFQTVKKRHEQPASTLRLSQRIISRTLVSTKIHQELPPPWRFPLYRIRNLTKCHPFFYPLITIPQPLLPSSLKLPSQNHVSLSMSWRRLSCRHQFSSSLGYHACGRKIIDQRAKFFIWRSAQGILLRRRPHGRGRCRSQVSRRSGRLETRKRTR